MFKIGKTLALIIAFGAVAAPAMAQMTPLARLGCTASNFPGCGWGPWGNAADFRRTLRAGQGPQGQDAVEYTLLPQPSHQFYMGWGTPTGGTPAAGAVRFVRFRIWIPGPTGQLRGYDNAYSAKFVILGDGGNDRMICNLRDNGMSSDTLAFECGKNINGGTDYTDKLRAQFTLGVWHSVQVMAQSGSSLRCNVRVWLDSNDFANPTSCNVGPTSFGVENWNFVGVGFYGASNRTITTDTPAFRIADDVEFDDQFDPNWHSGGSSGGSTPPSTPTGVRVLTSSVDVLLLGAGLASLALRFRTRRNDAQTTIDPTAE